MSATDPMIAAIILVACSVSGSVCFALGAAMAKRRADAEKRVAISEIHRLAAARSVLDLRDDSPLS